MTSPLSILWESFYSPAAYRNAASRWKGAGFWILVLFTVVSTLTISVKMHLGINRFNRVDVPPVIAQLPVITFANGTATTPEAKAYHITDPSNGELLAIIDTTRESPPAGLGGAQIFVSRFSVVVQKNDTESRTYSLAEIDNYELTREKASGLMQWLANGLALVCSPFIFIGILIARACQWLFFSLMTLALSHIYRLPSSYPQTLRLTAAAMTPTLFIDALLGLAGATPPFFWLLFILLIAGYLWFAVASLRRAPSPTPPVPDSPTH